MADIRPFPPTLGSFVTYVTERGDRLLAHVLAVNPDGTVNLRAHRIAQKDLDIDKVRFAPKIKPNHWSRGVFA